MRFSELISAATLSSPPFGVMWDSVGFFVGLILIFLLSAKELVRAYGGPRTAEWMRLSNYAIVPLLAILAVAIVERLLPTVTVG